MFHVVFFVSPNIGHWCFSHLIISFFDENIDVPFSLKHFAIAVKDLFVPMEFYLLYVIHYSSLRKSIMPMEFSVTPQKETSMIIMVLLDYTLLSSLEKKM